MIGNAGLRRSADDNDLLRATARKHEITVAFICGAAVVAMTVWIVHVLSNGEGDDAYATAPSVTQVRHAP